MKFSPLYRTFLTSSIRTPLELSSAWCVFVAASVFYFSVMPSPYNEPVNAMPFSVTASMKARLSSVVRRIWLWPTWHSFCAVSRLPDGVECSLQRATVSARTKSKLRQTCSGRAPSIDDEIGHEPGSRDGSRQGERLKGQRCPKPRASFVPQGAAVAVMSYNDGLTRPLSQHLKSAESIGTSTAVGIICHCLQCRSIVGFRQVSQKQQKLMSAGLDSLRPAAHDVLAARMLSLHGISPGNRCSMLYNVHVVIKFIENRDT